MLIALLIAASTPFASYGDMTYQVCGPALDVVMDRKVPLDQIQERYLGRLEMRMEELKLDEEERDTFRRLCSIYVAGAAKAMRDLSLDGTDLIQR